ncbi:uncharacterized protein LOC133903263 [Phragmites australis]|uniref:uncharacterized protein LOC133903263 n=1 Tax=Phragmites australis TaxID=29695 RepID=UPI002D79B2EB|nr:uncharacterized protein LOC133903263 [Phragmites australis]
MSKQPAAPRAGGDPRSRARVADAASSQTATGRNRVSYVLPAYKAGQATEPQTEAAEQLPGHDDAGATARPRHSYVPPSQRRREQPPRPAIEQPPDHAPYPPPPGSIHVRPGGAAPPRRVSFPIKTMERISTLEDSSMVAAPTGGSPPPLHAHHAHMHPRARPTRPWSGKMRQPVGALHMCFTACCILFCLLLIVLGVAALVVYQRYHPQLPRMLVTTATLNAEDIARGGQALNTSLTVAVTIHNPNTKIDVVLHYTPLDLYFHGSLIETQLVWPAPLHEEPGGSVLRSVHMAVNLTSEEDVALWHNATTKGGAPVELSLVGRFHARLNFGRWLSFKYWVHPSCTLWLDSPPGSTLRRVQC